MRRRAFTSLLCSAVVAQTLPVRAQQSKGLPIVGLVNPTLPLAVTVGPDPVSPLVRGFVHGMRDLGWIDGRNVIIERRSTEGDPQRAPALFAELIARGVDVFMIGGARWLQDAALAATQVIPIVAPFTDDPIAAGLIKSLPRPGGNLTGVMLATGPEFQDKRLQLLTELVPGLRRVAFLASEEILQQYQTGVKLNGITVLPFTYKIGAPYDEVFAHVLREKIDAMMVGGGVHAGGPERLAAFAAEHRVPTMFPWREGPDAGGLISYGTNVAGVWRQSARLVARFLEGAKPGDVPVEQPTKFELVVNIKTAMALGLSIPLTLLARADEVIE